MSRPVEMPGEFVHWNLGSAERSFKTRDRPIRISPPMGTDGAIYISPDEADRFALELLLAADEARGGR